MDPNTFFNSLWPTLSVGVIAPLVQWIKGIMPGDWPIQSTAISAILNFLSIYGLNEVFSMGLTFEAILPYATAGFMVSSGAHALYKTKKKNTLT